MYDSLGSDKWTVSCFEAISHKTPDSQIYKFSFQTYHAEPKIF